MHWWSWISSCTLTPVNLDYFLQIRDHHSRLIGKRKWKKKKWIREGKSRADSAADEGQCAEFWLWRCAQNWYRSLHISILVHVYRLHSYANHCGLPTAFAAFFRNSVNKNNDVLNNFRLPSCVLIFESNMATVGSSKRRAWTGPFIILYIKVYCSTLIDCLKGNDLHCIWRYWTVAANSRSGAVLTAL